MAENDDWVFGYGSLIYKVDFPYLDREPAQIEGWARRFWQGSHDHRGTPDAPGRVVTLVPDAARTCRGMAYRVEHDVFEHLDHREKNGYQHHRVTIDLLDRGTAVAGMIYVAGRDNPAFLGPDKPQVLAEHIVAARGPSGLNRDYLLRLAESLRELGDEDEHVFDLERRVRALLNDAD
ncbi:gamma-glutamylcyclotransferase [Wenzhouxiangella sp. EGI_FJ10305]|uniref:gamma-glutamylcyclotransferase n=1 Tax=Wenzhouxiangella sp. EGI_FJ10305 TaxID=3243768 RepID=UPI0035DA2511